MTEEFMESFAKGIRRDKKNTNIAALKWQIGDQENPNFNLTGYRADKEPDATWHRPSNHRPPHISPEEAEYRSRASGNAGNYPHIFNPDVECREDDYIPQEQPKQPDKPQENTNRTCNYNGKQYVIRNGNVYDLKGNLQSNHIRDAVINLCNQRHNK